MYTKYDNFVPIVYVSCTNFAYNLFCMYIFCIHGVCTKYIQHCCPVYKIVQNYVQNTYKLDVMVAVFLLAKPPPSTTQNGMFLSYNHHKNLKNNILYIQNVYKICQPTYKMFTKYNNKHK